MSLQFLGGDTGDGGSPRLYQQGDDFLVQGYTVNETQLLAELDIPDGETVVRVPQSLWKYLPARQRESQRTEEGRREQMPVRLGHDAAHRETRNLCAEQEAAWWAELSDLAEWEAYRRRWLGLMSAAAPPRIASAGQVSRVLRRGTSALMTAVTDLRVIEGTTRLVNYFSGTGTWVGSEMIDGSALARQYSSAFNAVWALSAPHVRHGPA